MTIITRTQTTWLVPSETTVGLVYIVKLVDGDHLSCDCDGSFYRGTCKHIKAVAAKIAADKAAAAAETAFHAEAHTWALNMLMGRTA